tara:strand:+ start:816 stop:1763 length:948 start_codon:yes stop_codon:yes gene_type:complete
MFDLSNKKGLMFAFSTAIIWGLYTVLMKVGIVNFQLLHPVSFILSSYIIGSLTLLVLAGPGKLSLETFKNPATWVYGLFNLLNNIFLTSAFIFVISATSATLLIRFGVLISILVDMILVKQFNFKFKLPYATLAVGTFVVAYGVESNNVFWVIFFVGLSTLCQIGQMKFAELHKQNNQATGDLRSEFRVTGFVTAVTTVIYMVFVLLLTSTGIDFGKYLPTTEQWLDLDSLMYASFIGAVIVSLDKFLIFMSTKSLGATNFLTIVALTPLFAMVCEQVLVAFNILEPASVTMYEIVGGFIIISSVIGITLSRVKK